MYAFVLEALWKAIPNKFHFSLKTGLATSDSNGTHGDLWSYPGNAITESNSDVHNFRFNKYYKFNSIVWEKILGRFSSGVFGNIGFDYFVTEALSLNTGLTVSSALYSSDTIVGSSGTLMAVEPYLSAAYTNKHGLRVGVDYQFAVPFAGLGDADVVNFLSAYIGFVF